MKYDTFTIKANKMLFWRLGNMNSVKQTHWHTDSHQPPTKRGIWCFPYPHYDLFFCWHQWERHMPKKFQGREIIGVDRGKLPPPPDFDKMTDEEAQAHWDERDRLIKEIRKRYRPTQFWYGGEFYSHIPKKGEPDYNGWFYWDSVKEWAAEAKKHLSYIERYDDHLYTFRYSKDHLEIFIPNY